MQDPADFDRYVPRELQENYAEVLEQQHGGDWAALARNLESTGDEMLARWAASHVVKEETVHEKPVKARKASE